MKDKSCCFVGNKKIKPFGDVSEKFDNLISNLLEKNVKECFFSGRGDFNKYCRNALLKAKKNQHIVKLVYFQPFFVSQSLNENLLDYYDNIVTQNYEFSRDLGFILSYEDIIDRSDIVVFYFDNKNIEKETFLAYIYAKKLHKEILNAYYL